MSDDRYLWDGSGPPDPEIQAWERRLCSYRRRGAALRRRRSDAILPRALAAAAALLLLVSGALWIVRGSLLGGWRAEPLLGSPRLSAGRLERPSRLRVGDAIETDAVSRARLQLRAVGTIDVAPGSRLRLVASRVKEERLALDRGEIHASVSAPPRLFAVETGAATAVDLGCDYTLTIAGGGVSHLSVTRGWVELGARDHDVIVPAGFDCASAPGRGPGTPRAQDAPRELVRALDRFDAGEAGALAGVLDSARPGDGLTLWHLLRRTGGADRVRVFERLSELVPRPPGVTRERTLALDERALDQWRFEMGTPPWPRELSLWNALRARLTR